MSYLFDIDDRKQFHQLRRHVLLIENQMDKLANELSSVNYKLQSLQLRTLQGELLTQAFIQGNIPYLDLSPEKAFEIYQDPNKDYCILDISRSVFIETSEVIPLPESENIPFENLYENLDKLGGKHRTILVMSEDGTKSILACKMLCELGFLNVNNVSGGHKFWPGHRKENQLKSIA